MILHSILANKEELSNKKGKKKPSEFLGEIPMPSKDSYLKDENPEHGQTCTFRWTVNKSKNIQRKDSSKGRCLEKNGMF